MANGNDDRRSLRERVGSAARSVAGTLGEGARDVAETTVEGAQELTSEARQRLRNRQARQDLESFRDEEVTDQGEARLQRARQEAQQEARQEARQEFREEYREQIREETRENRVEELRREFGLEDDEQEQQGFGFGMGGGQQEQRQAPPGLGVGQPVDTDNDGEAEAVVQRGPAGTFLQPVAEDERDPPGAQSAPPEDRFELRFIGDGVDNDVDEYPLRF
jgi:hypothetical protein